MHNPPLPAFSQVLRFQNWSKRFTINALESRPQLGCHSRRSAGILVSQYLWNYKPRVTIRMERGNQSRRLVARSNRLNADGIGEATRTRLGKNFLYCEYMRGV